MTPKQILSLLRLQADLYDTIGDLQAALDKRNVEGAQQQARIIELEKQLAVYVPQPNDGPVTAPPPPEV